MIVDVKGLNPRKFFLKAYERRVFCQLVGNNAQRESEGARRRGDLSYALFKLARYAGNRSNAEQRLKNRKR